MKRLSERLRRSSTASQRAATLPEMLEELRMLYRHLIETPKSTKLAGKTLHLSQVQGYLSDNPAYAITSASQVIWKGPLTLFPIGRNRPTQWDNSDSVQYENVVMWLEQSIESIEKTILLSPAKDLENNGCESHIQQPVELEPRSSKYQGTLLLKLNAEVHSRRYLRCYPQEQSCDSRVRERSIDGR